MSDHDNAANRRHRKIAKTHGAIHGSVMQNAHRRISYSDWAWGYRTRSNAKSLLAPEEGHGSQSGTSGDVFCIYAPMAQVTE